MHSLDRPTLGDALRALPPAAEVVCPHTGERLDAADLDAAATRFAHRLLAAGVRPGEVVGVLAPTGPLVLTALFGAALAGAAASMFPAHGTAPQREAERLAPAVDAAGMRHLAVHPDCAETAAALRELRPDLTLVHPDLPPAHPETPAYPDAGPVPSGPVPSGPLPEVAPGDLAVVQFTSGSTSAPKGVALTHANVLAGLRAIVVSSAVTDRDVMVSWAPHFHDLGLFGPLSVLFSGGRVHLLPPLEFLRRPARILRLMSEAGGTMLTGPDFSYRRLAAAATPEVVAGLDLTRWRLAYNGAEPVRAATVEEFTARLAPAGLAPHVMYPVYGMAEAVLAVAFPVPGTPPRTVHLDRRLLAEQHRAVEVPSTHPHAKPLVSVGRPVHGLELRLVDRDGAECPPGRLGEIQLAGPAVTPGYHRHPVANAEAFDGRWLRTGDLGVQLDGELYVTGRRKEMIIVNGQNFFPEDAERLARGLPGVHRDHCVAFADDARETLALAVEIAPGHDPDAVAAQLRRTLAERLGLAAVDVHPLRPGRLPRTTSGKWQRGVLREQLATSAG